MVLLGSYGTTAFATTWTFDSDAEGWEIVSDPFRGHVATPSSQPATFDATTGLPAGSLRVGDVYFATSISAPASVLGNRLDLYGTELSYDILLELSDDVAYPAATLNGGTMSLYYDLDSPPVGVWENVQIPLSEAGWRVGVTDTPATQAEFQSVLSTLSGIYILTEWYTGDDDTSVDNISIGIIPEPSTLCLAFVALAVPLAVRRKRGLSCD